MFNSPEIKCTNCGAIVQGKVCQHCGTPMVELRNTEAEKQALEDYHRRLSEQNHEEQAKWLRAGFIPADPDVLIEAGIRLLAMIDESRFDVVSDAAASRLEAIITKLRLVSNDEHTQQLIWDFQSKIAKYRSANQRFNRGLCLAAMFIVLCPIAGIVWLIAR